MAHYCYSLGREGILPKLLARTHPRWQSPYLASLMQSGITVLVVLLISLIIEHTNPDSSVTYAIGIADGKVFTQTGGIAAFQWLASLFSMCLIVVYLLTNIAVFFFARRRKEFRVFAHLVAPAAQQPHFIVAMIAGTF